MAKLHNKLENIVRKYVAKPLVIGGLVGILACGGKSYAQEFRVNTQTGGFLTSPRIAMNDFGDFIITWRGGYAQRFDRHGNRVGEEFRVGEGLYSSIAMDKNRNFITAWSRWEGDPIHAYHDVYAQKFDEEGNRIGEEFQVNTFSEYSQISPVVAMNDEGRFVICWKYWIYEGDPENAFFTQIFDKKQK